MNLEVSVDNVLDEVIRYKEFMYQKVNYLDIKGRIFEGETAEEIYAEIKEKK